MSKGCELQKEYYQAKGNYKGNGKYSDEYVSWLEEQILALRIHDISGSLPSKDEAVNVGFRKATNADYNFRKVCKDLDHDLYYSGWMDCYDWLSGNDR